MSVQKTQPVFYVLNTTSENMKVSCSQCHEIYELPTSIEYLLKMGLIPFDKPLYCTACRK